MKLLLLTVCCVISTSLAGPFSDKEEKLEAALKSVILYSACTWLEYINSWFKLHFSFSDIELVLQDLHKNEAASDDEYLGDIPRPK